MGDDGTGKQYTSNDIMEVLLSNQNTLHVITADIASIKTDIVKVKSDHKSLQQTVTAIQSDVTSMKAEIDRLKGVEANYNTLKDAYCRSQVNAVKQQYNSMQFNVIARNVPEHIEADATQETQEKSIEHATTIIHDVFGIDRDVVIPLVTAHRLPSTKLGPKPLIFKLAKLSDKQKLWQNIRNVKKYNSALSEANKVKIQMVQLPEKLANDRNSLQADYDTARNNELAPKWLYLRKSGIYCYKIGNTLHKPKVNHFMHKYTNVHV